LSGTHGPVQPEGFLDAIILGRLFTRNNVLAIFTGPTGIGKSWGALKMAENE